MNESELMTRGGLAERLSISVRYTYTLQKYGMPVVWVGGLQRFDYPAVRVWMKQYKAQQKKRGGDKSANR